MKRGHRRRLQTLIKHLLGPKPVRIETPPPSVVSIASIQSSLSAQSIGKKNESSESSSDEGETSDESDTSDDDNDENNDSDADDDADAGSNGTAKEAENRDEDNVNGGSVTSLGNPDDDAGEAEATNEGEL